MYRLRILVNGSPIPVYYDQNGNMWVEGREGTHFSIKVENSNWNRVLAVVSVDGLNIINAKHEKPENSQGYIIHGNSSINVPGWKINQDKVREFVFTKADNSYSSKIGADPANVGVIGCVIFSEKNNWKLFTTSFSSTIYPSRQVDYTVKNTGNFPLGGYSGMSVNSIQYSAQNAGIVQSAYSVSSANVSNDIKLGIGAGERADYKTHKTDFEIGNEEARLLIYYDSYEGLKRRGIIKEIKDVLPNAFPDSNSYCPDI